MGRKIQVCALSLIGAFGYTTSAFAQPAEAPSTAKPAEATAGTTEPAAASAPADVAPAAPPPAAPEPAPPPSPIAPDTASPASFESFKVENKNGSATLKVGLLLQPQYDAIGSADAQHTGTTNNLFLRRTRLLVGGTLFKTFEYFFDTDAPNLFKSDAAGVKTTQGIVVQDAIATWKAYEDMLKFDAGYMLTPGAHNALQGAGTLLGVDYFSNTFNHTNVFNAATAPVGRDAGIEVRGLLFDNHIEYRAGLFQGLRKAQTAPPMMPAGATGDVAGQNMFRFAGRIQVNLLDAETGFFYAGTYLGKKKILSVGGALDMQSSYHHWAVDGFLDLPAGPGTLTAQVNFAKWNGGDFIPPNATTMAPTLPNQTALMAEAGYRFDAFPIAPIAKFENLNYANSDRASTRVGGGLAYFPYGHNINLKAFFTNINDKPATGDSRSYNEFQLQWQLYFY
ncbi:MAG: porin [Pseudomonadota bacterium]